MQTSWFQGLSLNLVLQLFVSVVTDFSSGFQWIGFLFMDRISSLFCMPGNFLDIDIGNFTLNTGYFCIYMFLRFWTVC